MPSEQACCSPYYSVLRFFPLPAERDGFSHHQHCGAQFYGGLGGSSALGLLQAGGRIAFHCLALIAGIVVIMLVSRLLKLRQQHLLQPA